MHGYYNKTIQAAAGLATMAGLAIGATECDFAQLLQSAAVAAPAALSEARQLILVTGRDWEGLYGQLRRYDRPSPEVRWRAVGLPVAVVLGGGGLGWGVGLHGNPPGTGPLKREGDGKSPAGVFQLRQAFGYGPPPNGLKLDYLQVGTTWECVDDPNSRYYNTLLDREKIALPDWTSSERMRRMDNLYHWGIIVDHNADRPLPHAGSCIFLHIWAGPSQGTAGCTAMDARKLEEILFWLDPAAGPVLVQLPDAEYRRLRMPWKLPF
jgi:D-alanyl-D-alanine dipeptidase